MLRQRSRTLSATDVVLALVVLAVVGGGLLFLRHVLFPPRSHLVAFGEVPLAASPAVRAQLDAALAAGDQQTLAELRQSHQVADLPADSTVELLDVQGGLAHVRVVDGPVAGREGYLPQTLLGP